MEGTIKILKTGFGFIEESITKRLWFFTLRDLTKFQMIREGFKVRFEKKDIAREFEQKLNQGLFKDADIAFRNPNPRKALRDSRGDHRGCVPSSAGSAQSRNPVEKLGTAQKENCMKSEYENKIDNLEGKVQRLEARIEELLSLKTGPRGPQGPIDVCVTQAVAGTEKVVERQLASLFERVDEYARRESAYRKESIDGVRGVGS
jgi:hypothetical protein